MTANRALIPAEPLGDRDWAILHDLQRVRLLTGAQLERLHFASLQSRAVQGSARRRSLGRLVKRQLVTTLPRRIGGERAGSAGLVYTLDAAGYRLLSEQDTQGRRIRRPWSVGWPFVLHTLDVAELYVRLYEQDRRGRLRLIHFDAEPESWYRKASGAYLKPDAFVVSDVDGWEHHLWLEVDRATESLPTLRRKLVTYLDALEHNEPGPSGVLPLVLVTLNSPKRMAAVSELVAELTPRCPGLIRVADFDSAFTEGLPPSVRPPPG